METVIQIDNITEILKDLSEPAIKEVQITLKRLIDVGTHDEVY